MNMFYISIKLERKKRGRDQHSDPVGAEWLSWYAHNHTAQAEEGCCKACLWIRAIFTEKKYAEGFIFQLLQMGWFYAQSEALVNNSVILGERVSWPPPFSISSIWGKERIR